MIKSFFLSLACFNNKVIRTIFLKTIALTFVIFIALGIAIYSSSLSIPTIWGMDIASWSYIITGIVTSLLTLFLFRMVAVLILWMFADDIVEAIAWQYYGHAAVTAIKPGYMIGLWVGLRSVLRMIIYNILAIPLYILGFFTIVGLPIIFICINGLLLGVELEEMVALRHKKSTIASNPQYELGRFRRFILGMIMNGAMMIPFVNLCIPVIAVSMATHMMYRKG